MAIGGSIWSDGVWEETAWGSALWQPADPATYLFWGSVPNWHEYHEFSAKVQANWARGFSGPFSVGSDYARLVGIEVFEGLWKNSDGLFGDADGPSRFALYAGGASYQDMTGATLIEDFGQRESAFHSSRDMSGGSSNVNQYTGLNKTWQRFESLTQPYLPDNTQIWFVVKHLWDVADPRYFLFYTQFAPAQGDLTSGRVGLTGTADITDHQLPFPDTITASVTSAYTGSQFLYPFRLVYEIVEPTDDDILRLRDGTYRRRYSWGL